MRKMDVLVNDRHFNNGKVTVNLSFLQWLKLKLDGRVKVFEATKPGWKGLMPFYIAKCDGCGEYYLDYIHGNSRLYCPNCDES